MFEEFDVTPEARRDLRELWAFIADDDLDVADRVLDEMTAAFARLAQMPGLGHTRRDLTARPVLFWPVYSYLIVYRPHREPLQIIAVIHGARDVYRILQNRP